ncbi:reverse transcriptase domain-containing protein [Tanacetum coccineum]
MTGVPKHIVEHKLNVHEGCLPVRQKKRSQAVERNKAIQEEVEKLVDVGITKEVHYHSWLSNPVMVKKHDDSWRIYPFKCFLDAYNGYHQIKIAEEDEEKTTVITCQWIFCYSKMPFGLKNARATYQRLVDKAFQKQIGKNLEAETSLPFFKTLKKCTKKSDFQWTVEAEVAFKQMKKLIAELPTLTAPIEREELIVYLAAAQEAVSVVLMTERETEQMSVYFASRAMQGPEINYTPMENLVLALVHTSKRLKRYFHAHTIVVITDQPIKQVLARPEVAGRLQKWSIKLGEYDIQYKPRTSVKGQILADFIMERLEDDPPDTTMEAEEELRDPWTLFTDGSSYVDGFEPGLILINSKGAEFTYILRFRFDATNNEAEYEALIADLRITKQMGVKNLQTNVDSCLVANQVLFEELNEKSIFKAEVLAVVEEEGDTWMTPIYSYLTEETLLAKKEKARAIKHKLGRYAHACRNKICGSKGYTNRILLANNPHGCKKTDKGMSRLPGSPLRA